MIIRGVFWNSAFQIFVAAVSFGSMLVLVRVVAPAEYGRVTAVTGVVTLINCLNCCYFIAQAVQLREGEQPDWAAHWRAGFYIQMALTLLCNIVAGLAWLVPAYRPIAPLLHLASLGLLVDFPSKLSMTMLQRDMDFRRMRLVQGVGVLTTAGASVLLGLLGAGAYAMILGSNVLHGLPFGFDLLVLRRWRPPAGWWRWPDWGEYRSALRFGAQFSGTALLAGGRGLLESLVLPQAIGYEAMGLLSRAQVLFSTTVGRLNNMMVETVYPLLPRSAGDAVQFARHATLFVQAMLLISIPGALFVGLEGPSLSRLLYGQKWLAADPFIWPGTLFAWGVAVLTVFGAVLLAANRLRLSLLASLVAASLSLPAVLVALRGGGTQAYVWALAAGQLTAALVAMALTSPCLESRWSLRALLPPVVASALGASTLAALGRFEGQVSNVARLSLHAAVFGSVILLTLRAVFPSVLKAVVTRLPGGEQIRRGLRL